MTTSFPGGIDTTSTLPNSRVTGNTIQAADQNNQSDAIIAIETELGTDPSGGFATVKARLDAIGSGGAYINVKDYGTTGTADDTSVFTAALTAAGEGGTVLAPAGTYIVADLAFTHEGQSIVGVGMGPSGSGTVLKAKTGATYVLKNQGKRYQALRNITISGNTRASRGVLVEATASATSQSLLFDRVWFYRCSRGLHIGVGSTNTQADKNLLLGCQFIECNYGLYNEAANGQETILLNADFTTTYNSSIYMTAGTLRIVGGQFQGSGAAGTKGIELAGYGVDWISLYDVIFEGPDTDLYDGGAMWPRDGVIVENVVFQGTTANVIQNTVNGRMTARHSRFNDATPPGGGVLSWNQTGGRLILENCDYGYPNITGANPPVVASPGGISDTLVDAKGDLLAATAADSVTRLPVGTNGQVLTAASGQATGLQWTTPAGTAADIVTGGTLSGASSSQDLAGKSRVLYTATVAANHALTFNNTPSGAHITLALAMNATGGYTFSVNGTALDINQAPSSTTLVDVWYDGTNYYVNDIDPSLYAIPRPAGNKLKTWTTDPAVANATLQPTAGVGHYMQVPWPCTATLSTVWWNISTVGATLTNAYFGLYSQSGTLIAKTADQSSTLTGTTGIKSAALTAEAGQSLTNVAGGIGRFLYIGLVIGSATTSPIIRSGGTANVNLGLAATDPYRAFTRGTGLTALPSTVDFTTSTTAAQLLALGLS